MILEETAAIIRRHYGERLKGITLERLVVGLFFTGVKLSNGRAGISYTPASSIHHGRGRISAAFLRERLPGLEGTSVHEVLNAGGSDPLIATMRIVVLNALSELSPSQEGYRVIADRDVLDIIDLGSVRRVGMVGAFSTFLKTFKAAPDIDIHVVEKKKENLVGSDRRFYVPSAHARDVLPRCDTVIITGASIANNTIDELLSFTNSSALVIVAGPTASFLPDAFFARNVDIVSGVHVTRPERALDLLSQGMTALDLFGEGCLRKINMVNPDKGRAP